VHSCKVINRIGRTFNASPAEMFGMPPCVTFPVGWGARHFGLLGFFFEEPGCSWPICGCVCFLGRNTGRLDRINLVHLCFQDTRGWG